MSEKLQPNNVGATKAQKIQQKTGKGNNMQNQQNQNKAKANNVQKAKQKPVKGNNVRQKPNQKNMPKQHHAQPVNAQQKSQPSEAAKQQTQSQTQTLQMAIDAARKSTTTIREVARVVIDACFDQFWGYGKNVVVSIISFRLKETIPLDEWNETAQGMLERARQDIIQSVGRTEYVWLRKRWTLERHDTPTYEAVFISNGGRNFPTVKSYFATLKRHLLIGKEAYCEAFAMDTPPRHSAPGYMAVSNKADNLEAGKYWLDKLTDAYAKTYVVVGFGCSQIKPQRTVVRSSKSSSGTFSDEKQQPGKRAM